MNNHHSREHISWEPFLHLRKKTSANVRVVFFVGVICNLEGQAMQIARWIASKVPHPNFGPQNQENKGSKFEALKIWVITP